MIALLFLNIRDTLTDMQSDDYCSSYSNTDCKYCLANSNNNSCGYCIETKVCESGDADGPFAGNCTHWALTNTPECQADSRLGYSTGVRIGVGVFVGIVTVVTAVFWIWVFPILASRPRASIERASASTALASD
jgi:hypothetical protein